MLILAAIDLVTALPLVIGILGIGGLVFTALRFRRDDTTAVVTQQAQITSEMKTLNDELRATTADLRAERDKLRLEVSRLEGQITELRAQLSGRMSRIERRNDG